MKPFWIIPLLGVCVSAAGQEHRRIVDLKIDGMTSREDHVSVARALAASPSIERVVFRVSGHGVRVHAVLKKEALPLAEVEEALAAARRGLKEAQGAAADFRLDETDLKLPAGTRFEAGGEGRRTEKETTLAEFRKSQPFTMLELPSAAHPSSAFVCPEGCATADEEATCPKCGSALEKVEAPAEGG